MHQCCLLLYQTFTTHLPVAVFSSSSSSLSDARKGTVARSSSSARTRPIILKPWILQSIPELRHCFIAISTYLWYWKIKTNIINKNSPKKRLKDIYHVVYIKPTSVQSLSKATAVSVGLILMVFNSIRLLYELPPERKTKPINLITWDLSKDDRRAL